MPQSDLRLAIRRRRGLAAVGILAVLVFYGTLSWIEVSALKVNTTYATAFSRLIQATTQLELSLHRSFSQTRNVTADVRAAGVQKALDDLLMIFSVLRATDEDGIADHDQGQSEESEEQAWDELAEGVNWDSATRTLKLELNEGTMPSHLAEIWESDDDRKDSLEDHLGTLIASSLVLVNAQGIYDDVERRQLIKLERLMDEQIHPTLDQVSVILENESKDSANLILAILIISAILIAVVALITVLAYISPPELEQDPIRDTA